jgi:hypothetical protein
VRVHTHNTQQHSFTDADVERRPSMVLYALPMHLGKSKRRCHGHMGRIWGALTTTINTSALNPCLPYCPLLSPILLPYICIMSACTACAVQAARTHSVWCAARHIRSHVRGEDAPPLA